ncbi:MAG: family 88 glycosyl hydrolase [Chitinophaga sp.]|jgi:unsaturated rhamnogalacturonyl hydrolase|nr:family 88 glycosyl hydrolase [Chitinophaga sp.]
MVKHNYHLLISSLAKKVLVTLFIVSIVTACTAQTIPSKKETIKAMELANAYFMNKWPDAGKTIVTNRERPSNIWTRAVYYEGLMALYSIDKKQSFIDYALQWSEFHKWNMRNGIKTRNADDQACGQTYIDLYLMDKKEERIKNIKACIDSMMASSKIDDWSWVDAIQMSMPVFARLGVVYNDTNYFKRMYEMYAFSKYKHGGNGLYNAAESLWWRDKDFVPPYKEPNGANCYWSRGNGWVVAALVRTLQWLPENNSHYNELMSDYKNMLKALLSLQRKDSFWNVSLADSTHFGGKELTGTALFVYGMAWGINNNLIDKKTYLPVLLKAWNALVTDCLHADGKLGFVQGTGKEPKDGQPVTYDSTPDFEDYGLGCFLLAGSEVYKLK